jgi:hypothetical protein
LFDVVAVLIDGDEHVRGSSADGARAIRIRDDDSSANLATISLNLFSFSHVFGLLFTLISIDERKTFATLML